MKRTIVIISLFVSLIALGYALFELFTEESLQPNLKSDSDAAKSKKPTVVPPSVVKEAEEAKTI
jgi:hypothetical protein